MSSATNILQVAVLSDMHAFEGKALPAGLNHPSYLDVSNPQTDPTRNPVEGLLALIHQPPQHLKADLVLCAGDMGDKSSPAGIAHAWESLHRIGEALGATLTTATAGNHDLDSRHISNKYDPRGFLMTLNPRYPLLDESLTDRYWGRNYVIVDGDRHRLVLLNSCGYHSGSESPEIRHGRISEWTLDFLVEDLRTRTQKTVNILLCHHHPQFLSEIEYDDYEIMKGGNGLLDRLSQPPLGNWLVIHGHKHYPKLDHGPGGNQSAVVFSAGSLSAVLYDHVASLVRNQFYLLTIPLSECERHGLVGEIRAWNWGQGVGWRPAHHTDRGLAHISGFGLRTSLRGLAARIATHVTSPLVAWSTIISIIPELKYVMPCDMRSLEHDLKVSHQINIVFDEQGNPAQIGKYS